MSKSVCYICDLIWSLTIMAGCTYLVFWKDQSGGWYVLALFMCSMWSCKKKDEDEEDE